MQPEKTMIRVCNGKKCRHFNQKNFQYLQDQVTDAERDKIEVEQCTCLGQCKTAPNVLVVHKGLRRTVSHANPQNVKRELDAIRQGKKPSEIVPKKPASSAVNSLLSGGF
jgi:NADH:ubiquinone oxidoreductase subunit E